MAYKRIVAFVLCAFTALSLTACEGESGASLTSVNSTNSHSEEAVENSFDEVETTALSLPVESIQGDNLTATVPITTDPAMQTTAEIVDLYKKAAAKTNEGAKSERNITLKSISVNNGEFEGVLDFVTPVMAKIIAKNSTEVDGITGGYANLVASDVYSAKAYAVGNSTAVEMVMHEQTGGARDDALSGTVGHAITAVGDIGVVTDQLKEFGLPIEISDEHTKIYYTNPVVKVLIDSNGKIVKGTWSYTVDIRMNNYKAFGKSVESTSVVMENVITLE